MAMRKDLFRLCEKLTLTYQKKIYRIPWFKRELDSYSGHVNDETVCDLICNAAKTITPANPFYYEAHHVAAMICDAMQKPAPEFLLKGVDEYEILDNNQKQLYDILDELPIDLRLYLVRNKLFLKAAEERAPISSFIMAYYAFEAAFFEMIRKQYKNSKSINKQDWYLVFHKIANKYCYLIFDDPLVWRERLAAKLN